MACDNMGVTCCPCAVLCPALLCCVLLCSATWHLCSSPALPLQADGTVAELVSDPAVLLRLLAPISGTASALTASGAAALPSGPDRTSPDSVSPAATPASQPEVAAVQPGVYQPAPKLRPPTAGQAGITVGVFEGAAKFRSPAAAEQDSGEVYVRECCAECISVGGFYVVIKILNTGEYMGWCCVSLINASRLG